MLKMILHIRGQVMNREVINIRAFHVETELNHDFTVTLKFYGERLNSRTDNRSTINITFSWYYLRHFNSLFKKIARQAQARINDSGFNGKGE